MDPKAPQSPPPRKFLPEPSQNKTTKVNFPGSGYLQDHALWLQVLNLLLEARLIASQTGVCQLRFHHSQGQRSQGAAAVSDDTEVGEVEFSAKPGELRGAQFQRIVLENGFTRMGWEHPMRMWSSYLQMEVNQWALLYQSLSQFSEMRESWHKGGCHLACTLHGCLLWKHMFFLPEADKAHGAQVQEQKGGFTNKHQGEGHRHGPYLHYTIEEGNWCGWQFYHVSIPMRIVCRSMSSRWLTLITPSRETGR